MFNERVQRKILTNCSRCRLLSQPYADCRIKEAFHVVQNAGKNAGQTSDANDSLVFFTPLSFYGCLFTAVFLWLNVAGTVVHKARVADANGIKGIRSGNKERFAVPATDANVSRPRLGHGD